MKLITRPLLPKPAGLDPHPVGGRGSWLGGMGGAPVAFSAQTLASIEVGTNTPLNVGTLQLGFRSGYWIDEIRMGAWTNQLGGVTSLNGVGGVVAFQFQTGTKQFSKNAVPMGLYAPVFSQNDFGDAQTAGAGTYVSFSRVRWKLPKPLFMNPGDAIQCNVFNRSTVLSNKPINASVTYIGRALAQGAQPPISRQVPWIGWFEKDSNLAYAECTNELQNPFTSRLIVERFTSRTYRSTTGETPVSSLMLSQLPNAAGDGYCEVRLEDSLGYAIVPQFAPIGAVFDTSRHAWTFSRTMGPREQFNLSMRNAGTVTTRFFSQVAMIGYRDEEV